LSESQAKKDHDAVEWFSRTIDLLTPLAAGQTGHGEFRQLLCHAHWERALVLDRLGRHPEAVRDWDRAIALSDDTASQGDLAKNLPALRRQRALSLAHAGQHREAVAVAKDWIKDEQLPSATVYDAACIFAVSAAAAKDDDKLAGEYAAQAVELLRLAVQRGYTDVENLKGNLLFAGLRQRPDFGRVVEPLEKK